MYQSPSTKVKKFRKRKSHTSSRMNQMLKNKFLILSFASVLSFSVLHNDANAGWSKSSTTTTSKSYSFSKSYSYSKPAKSGWSVSSPKNTGISGFGSKPKEYYRPTPTSLNTNSNKSVFEKKQNAVSSTASLNNTVNRTDMKYNQNNSTKVTDYKGYNHNNQNTTVVNNTTVVKKKYYYGSSHTPVYYSVPSYYTPTHDHYGMISGMFLGMMLSHAMEPSYYNWAYSHYNDPSYLAWHQDMENQAQNNYELRQQLNQLDNKVDELRAENATKTDKLPDDVKQDQVNYHNDSIPDNASPEQVPAQVPTTDSPTTEHHSTMMIAFVSFLGCVAVAAVIIALAL